MGEINVLISSAGRRVGLTHCFRSSLSELGVSGKLLAIDASRDAPVSHLADGFWQVPLCSDPEFVPRVLEICERECVSLLIPTIDTELSAYSRAKDQFGEIGCRVCVSSSETIAITSDKSETHAWLCANGFPTVRQADPRSVLGQPDGWRFPLIAKPRGGSAGSGVTLIQSVDELHLRALSDEGLIVQELADGQEYTVNVFVDGRGNCLCAIPHRRIEVRAGEVSKAVTVKDRAMMQLACEVAERLPGAYGALNVQCFADAGAVKIIEINARFGGGYPLAHRAGGTFSRWLLEERLDRPVSASFDEWQDDLAMLRYDEAVFLPGQEIRRERYETAVSGV